MTAEFSRFRLSQWQQEFVDGYRPRHSRSLLVAPVGTGKTAASLSVAKQLFDQRAIDAVLVLSDHGALVEQWRGAASEFGLKLADRLYHEPDAMDGAAITTHSMVQDVLLVPELAKSLRWFIIVDEAHRLSPPIVDRVDHFLALNEDTKALFVSQTHLVDYPGDARFSFGAEFIFPRSVLESRETEVRLRLYAPSFGLLRKLQRDKQQLSELTWRQFEKLVADLLEADGYQVELMGGTKDGGVDVVATKDLGESGLFKGIWQAKKLAGSRRVGISTIRELADTRLEFSASKAIVVTSTYLTKGALQRVERDRYTLAKVDRDDLQAWVARVLQGASA